MTESLVGTRERNGGSDHRGAYLEAAWYALVAIAAVLGEFVILQLWRADLRVPFSLSGDAASVASYIKGVIENGWFWVNPSLGAPGNMNLLDYPSLDSLHWAIIKVLSASGNAAVTLNLYFLLTFPLVALSCAWALRRLGSSRAAAFAASMLYTFLPYHLFRSELHLFLSAYFMVPLLAYLAIGLFGPEPAFLERDHGGEFGWKLRSRGSLVAVAICVLGASTGVYYAVFGCFFILVAAAYGWWRTRERLRLLTGFALVGIIFLAVLINATPYVWHRFAAPPNAAAVVRNGTGVEVYSLRTALMVLPVRDHRVGLLAFVHYAYVHGIRGIAPMLDNEADFASLGLFGTLGFFFLLLLLLFGLGDNRSRAPGCQLLRGVATLTGAALLLASSGMFGTVIGVVFNTIRAYNRIVVFIAFFALLVVAAGIDWLGRHMGTRYSAWALPLLAVVVVVVGVYDQTTPAMVPAYAETAREWSNIGSFVARIEEKLPTGGQVFQLPYVPFPENPPVFRMIDYDHIKPYLASTNIHWSYGAVKGRETAAWNERVSALPTNRMVAEIRAKGFVGIWVDRYGYADDGVAIVAQLKAATGVEPIESGDGRYVFYGLR